MSYKKIIRRAGRILKGRLENAAESIFRTHEQEMADFEAELKKGKKTEPGQGRQSGSSSRKEQPREKPRKPGEMSDEECFRILGVPPTAGAQALKEAYKSLIAQYHPDKVAALGVELQQLAAKKTREINEAYQTLRRRRGF